ncbi:MAG: hypothetical protein ACLFTI_05920 [Anaerolineales bacterium]
MNEETIIAEDAGDVIEPDPAPRPEETEAAEPTPDHRETAQAFRAVLDETAKLFAAVGEAVAVTAQDVTRRLVIRVDDETRHHLDLLVQLDAVETREEAATYLMQEGIKAQQPLFEQIERTNERIAALRSTLKTIAAQPPG